MIIFSQSKLEINKIYGNNSIGTHKLQVFGKEIKNARFMVLREATEEEFINYYKEEYSKIVKPLYNNFYLISID